MAQEKQVEREARILEAAAQLFAHYGFDKTTVSEIAREAGVSKGAIYLHFDSKEMLLEALLQRELAAYTERWLALIDRDPRGGTIGGLYKNSLYALQESPFMSAVVRQDGRVLGSYLRKKYSVLRQPPGAPGELRRETFIQEMQAAGAVRNDLDAAVIAHIMNMFSYGLVSADAVMPGTQVPTLETVIEGIAEIMDGGLTPTSEATRSDPQAGKVILRRLFELSRKSGEPASKS